MKMFRALCLSFVFAAYSASAGLLMLSNGGRGVPPIVGGSGWTSTMLGTAASGLAANTWTTVTLGNSMDTDPPGSGDSMFSYSPKVLFDDTNGLIYFWGGVHGGGGDFQRFYLGVYTGSANTWTDPPHGGGVPTTPNPVHTYYASFLDTANEKFFASAPYLDPTPRLYTNGSGWTAPLPSLPAEAQSDGVQALAFAYDPSLYSAGGGVVLCSPSGIWTLNINGGSPAWTIIYDRTSQKDAMSGFPAAIYDHTIDAVLCGDDNGFHKVSGSGSGTRASAPLPSSVSVWPSNGYSILVPSDSHGPIAIDRQSTLVIEKFNGTSWSSVSTTEPAVLDGNLYSAAGYSPALGAIVFIKDTGGLVMSTTMHVWKY